MGHVAFIAFTVASAVLLARLEINVEGEAGWASRLPTWRVQNRWTRAFLGGKPLTGYHLWLFTFIGVLAHIPTVIGPDGFDARAELRILAFLTFLWILEDFLWFVLNPSFGIRRFRAEDIWWHRDSWLWIAPREYWIFAPVGALLYWLGTR